MRLYFAISITLYMLVYMFVKHVQALILQGEYEKFAIFKLGL